MKKIVSVNPATAETIEEFDELSEDQVKYCIAKANEAFQEWKKTSFSERSSLMKKASAVLEKNKEKYGKIMTQEMGKPITQSIAEVEKCAWVCDFYAENADEFLKDEIVKTESKKSYVSHEPLGIILAVMPWNFPFWQVFRFAAPVLMAGNVGLLKHASNVPRSALSIEEVFRVAGFPENTFKTLLISSRAVETVIKDERVKAVTLTGSETAGSKVAEAAGRGIKKTVLELGGSDPFIVLSDAQISTCAAAAADSRTLNAGQSCIAAKRFIVVGEKVAEFENLYKDLMASMKIGDPEDKETQVGPLAREDLLNDLDKQVQESIKMGAKLLTGGKRLDGKGYYYLPTLLTNVKKGMPVYDEETFGPVAAIIKVSDEEEAIKVANDSKYGLGASIWTKDTERAQELAKRIEAGNVFINKIVKSDPRLPFGGVKRSGYGRELSYHGIKEFVNIKTIVVG